MRRVGIATLIVGAVLASSATAQTPDAAAVAAMVETAKANPEASKAYAQMLDIESLALNTGPESASKLVANIRTYLAAPGASAFLVELGQRAARDQFWRKANVTELFGMSGGSTEEGRQAFSFLTGEQMMQTDLDNTAWLKAELQRREAWPGLSELGEQGASEVWLLVQHADKSPELQKQALALMTPMLATGEVLKVNYAYLYDRVAVHDGRPQRYGTQMDCSGPDGGVGAMGGLEDAATVNSLRAGMGVTPEKLEDQFAQAKFCRRQ